VSAALLSFFSSWLLPLLPLLLLAVSFFLSFIPGRTTSTKTTTAAMPTAASPRPRNSIFLEPAFFFAGLPESSPFLAEPWAAAPLVLALPLVRASDFFLAGASASSCSDSSGLATTKRYLHFGQSILRPISA